MKYLVLIMISFVILTPLKAQQLPPEARNQLDTLVAGLFGIEGSPKELPPVVSTKVFPFLKIYYIRTRVVIETRLVEDDPKKKVCIFRQAATLQRVITDIQNAEKIYSEIAIRFVVSQIIYEEPQTPLMHWLSASLHPGYLTIVYLLPNDLPYDGCSSMPWEKIDRGILITYGADGWTLAHETGHYFGLLHTFEEDYVDDTPQQEKKFCVTEKETSNCGDIMNYCLHTPKYITPQQKMRFTRFLRAKRLDLVTSERPGLLARP